MTAEPRYVDVPNARLWSVREGAGPAMAMLHGGPGIADYMAPVAARLADVATVHRYDQRGCGASAGGPPYDVATAIADLDAVRAAWGVERWTVFGHSWGASLALAYAIAHPERALGLIYVSGTGIDPAWHEAYRANRAARIPAGESAADELVRARTDLADPSRAPDVVSWLNARGLPVNLQVNNELGADANRTIETAAFADRLRALPVPTLVVHGDADPRPAHFAAQVANLIPGAELVVMANVGHYPRFEDPAGFDRAVRGFLSRLYSR